MSRPQGLILFAAGLACGAALGAAGLAVAQITLPAPTPTGWDPKLVGEVDLGKVFPQMAGYTMAMRISTVQPGAGKVLHSHKDSPEIVHVLSGTLTEQRDGGQPRTLGPGSTSVNDATVNHAVDNLGKIPVVFIAVGVRKATPTP